MDVVDRQFEQEFAVFYRFLKEHFKFDSLSYKVSGTTLDIIVSSSNVIDERDLIERIFSTYFQLQHHKTINFRVEGDEDDESVMLLEAKMGPPKKEFGSSIYIFKTESDSFRLFRFEPAGDSQLDESYFQPSLNISRRECSALKRTFTFPVQDLKEKRDIRNIIEFNINCLTDLEYMDNYLFSIRQIPKQFKDRYILSFVRVNPDTPLETLNKAVESTAVVSDNIFMSLTLNGFLTDMDKFLSCACSGLILTLGSVNEINEETFTQIDEIHEANISGKEILLLYYGVTASDEFVVSPKFEALNFSAKMAAG